MNARRSITRSPDPPAAGAIDTGGLTGGCSWHPLIRPRTSTTKWRARRAGTGEDLLHLPSQGLGGERFRNDRVSKLEGRPTKLFELGANYRKAGHVEHLRVGAPASQLAGQLHAVETGHHDVREQQVYRCRVGLRDPERLFAISGFQDFIPLCHENIPGELADIRLVINNQNGLHEPPPFRPRNAPSPFNSFDDLIRPPQERRRDRQAEGLGGLEVDDPLETFPAAGTDDEPAGHRSPVRPPQTPHARRPPSRHEPPLERSTGPRQRRSG